MANLLKQVIQELVTKSGGKELRPEEVEKVEDVFKSKGGSLEKIKDGSLDEIDLLRSSINEGLPKFGISENAIILVCAGLGVRWRRAYKVANRYVQERTQFKIKGEG